MPAIRFADVTGTETTDLPTDTPWPREYAATRARLRTLLAAASAADLATTVPACPAWTVHDVVAHLSGLAVALASGSGPAGGDVQAWLDALVDERRERPVAALLDEWDAVADATAAFLERMGPGGGQLVYDAVAHEHDIRHALGRPGARDSSSVVACAAAVSMLLARDLAAHGLPAVRITSGGRTWDVGEGAPGLAVALDPFVLLRVFGSRRSVAQLRTLPWVGDLDRYLPGLAHMPFPAADLHE